MTRRLSLLLLISFMCVVGVMAAPPQPSSVLSGRVLSDASPAEPVRRATVTLSGVAVGADIVVVTDDEGRFVFDRLPAGRYTISAAKPAYLPTFYGSRRVGRGPGVAIAVGDGQSIGDLTLVMSRGAVVSGNVRDAYGKSRSAQVSVLEVRDVNGERSLVPAKFGSANARGEYRVYGLMPGTYLVAVYSTTSDGEIYRALSAADVDQALKDARDPAGAATSSTPTLPGRPVAYAPTLFPGTTDPAGATPIVLRAGEERAGLDVQLLRVGTARVQGRAVDASGQVPRGLQISRVSTVEALGLRGGLLGGTRVSVANDGTFDMQALASGHYTLFARAMEGDARSAANAPLTLWGRLDVDVNGVDQTSLALHMLPGMVVNGHLELSGASALDVTKVQVRLSPAIATGPNLSVPPVSANADGTFSIIGVPPGEFVLSVSSPTPGWSAASARITGQANSVDYLDETIRIAPSQDPMSLTVALTDRSTTLTGHLLDPLGRPAPEYQVIVFTADRSHWRPLSRRIKLVRPATDGRFSIRGLPPGRYQIGAVSDIDPAEATSPLLLDALLSSSTAVALVEGETKSLDLEIGVTAPIELAKRLTVNRKR